IRAKLADMRLNIAAGELFVRRVAWLKDRGLPTPLESSSCKVFTSAAVMQTALQGVQVHGGYGYTRETAVERNMRDAKLAEIGGGTSEIQRQVVGRAVLRAKDQRWDAAYSSEELAARSGTATSAPNLLGACVAVAEHARRDGVAAFGEAADAAVRWSLRLAGQEERLDGAQRIREQVREEAAVSASIRNNAASRAASSRSAQPSGAGMATYAAEGQDVVNAAQAEWLLTERRLYRKPDGWSGRAHEHVLAPSLELGTVRITGEGAEVGATALAVVSRLFGAAVATGLAEAALDEALAAAREREVDQLVEFHLADIRTRVDSARMLVQQAALAVQTDRDPLNRCREARITAAEAAVFCAEHAASIAPGLGSPRLQELVRDCQLAAAIDLPLDQERQALAASLLAE
ncbi:MAG: hypothetical protein JO247_04415, partial [Chloroflexi bacterium]|nr:hypothetical protein [Chloroflexota bacterium]